MDTPASSLQRAVRLLYKTKSGKFRSMLTKSSTDKQVENALVEIRNTIIGVFNQWQQSELRSPPVRLRFLLETAVEFNVRGYVLQLAVFSSPHFSDAGFTETLRNCLVDTIKTAGGEMKTLAMLCFCVFYAIDSESITVPEPRNDECTRS
jgi:hypothetical protein